LLIPYYPKLPDRGQFVHPSRLKFLSVQLFDPGSVLRGIYANYYQYGTYGIRKPMARRLPRDS
jgi:hypothetical protein